MNDDLDRILEDTRKGYEAGDIKVYVAINRNCRHDPRREYLWARPITKTSAKLLNIPFETDAASLGDLVEHKDGKIIGLLERGALTFQAVFECEDPYEARRRWPMLRDHFAAHDIYVEWCYPGLFAMAVPCDIDPDRLMDIAAACPVTIEGIKEPEKHDRFARNV